MITQQEQIELIRKHLGSDVNLDVMENVMNLIRELETPPQIKDNEVLDIVSDCFTPNSVERAYFDGRNDSCDMFHIDNYR